MQLEKVTSRSSEAALAGWISSNDATLFTLVLIVVIAIFLHARLAGIERDSAATKAEQRALAVSLDATSDELKAVRDLLNAKTQALELTQSERDALQQQLAAKLDRITQLMTRLDAALAEKDQLAAESNALQTSNESMRSRLDELTRQLAERLAALEALAQERDRLASQADELEAIVSRLERANVELVGTRDSAVAVRASLENRVRQLESQLADHSGKADEYLAQLRRAAAQLENLTAENQRLQGALTAAEQQRQAQLAAEAQHNRELVGLSGPLRRVAILFDASGSMRQAAIGADGDRWAEAQDIAATWLRHLNVEQCVLIVFSVDVRTYPADGSLADFRGERGPAVRESLLADLKTVQPLGWTNTLAALERAYQYNVDTILLFSDGAPSMTDTGVFDPALAEQIYTLCRQHPNIPINSMGLGNYFDKEASTFLRTVARLTGGTFRGK